MKKKKQPQEDDLFRSNKVTGILDYYQVICYLYNSTFVRVVCVRARACVCVCVCVCVLPYALPQSSSPNFLAVYNKHGRRELC